VIPGTFAAVYVGDRLAAGFEHSDSRAFLVAGIVMVLLIAISFLPNLVHKLRHR
jgi:hypothetical protein